VPDSPFAGAVPSAVDLYQPLFAKIADGMTATGAFTEPEQWRFEWERCYTREQWLDQLPTQGWLTRVAPDALARILDGTGAAIDALGGAFTARYATVVVTAARRTSHPHSPTTSL
jgi:hypothetical protein